ncbi:MAG: hypothetical protein QG632_458 [Candidatus Dependentiae bacterium]|nr:hypothetical protein [Candidatus Dependentiae bacterium]
MKNALLSLKAIFFATIIYLGAPTLRAADSSLHPFGILDSINENEEYNPTAKRNTPPQKNKKTDKQARKSIAHNEYVKWNSGLSELPKYLRPNQKNSIIDEISETDLAFRFGKKEPLTLAHDRLGNLYFCKIIPYLNNKICYPVDVSGVVGSVAKMKNQESAYGHLYEIKMYINFLIVHLILLHIKNLLRKYRCFLKVDDITYYLYISQRSNQNVDNPIIATVVSGDAKPNTHLAHILLAQGNNLANRLESKVILFYTRNCCWWKKSKNADILDLIYNTAKANT